MSLRQRGQRPSEATDEGGHYASSPRPPNRAFKKISAGAGNDYPQSSQSQGGGGGPNGNGGYYNPASSYASPNGPPGAYVRAASNPDQLQQQQQQQQSSYPNAAAPQAYGAPRGNRIERCVSLPSVSAPPRAIQFDGGNAPGSKSSVGAGPGAPPPANGTKNPYKSKSSSGFGCKHVLLALFSVTFVALAGATLHFRGVTTKAELALEEARTAGRRKTRREEEARRSQGGRFDRGAAARDGYGAGAAGRRSGGDAKTMTALAEKKRLEVEIDNLRNEIRVRQESHGDVIKKHSTHGNTLQTLNSRKQDLLKTIDHTNNMLEDMVEETSKYKAMVDGMEGVEEYTKKREGALWSRIAVLQDKIGRESRREAEEWFGPGPHRVEFTLEYPKVQPTNPDSSSWPRIRGVLTIEMAPLDLMPHAVNLFMQQVHHGLWDGCTIVSNPHHLFQIGPSYAGGDPFGADDVPHIEDFRSRGLEATAFQEYDARYPHAQWTLGLAGRPGGPDFYVNKLDNTLIHGPGGQANKQDLHNEADPCFGKVVEGFDALEEIEQIPTDADQGFVIKYPVAIVGSRVLAPMENPDEGWREVAKGEKLLKDDGIMPLPEVPHGV